MTLDSGCINKSAYKWRGESDMTLDSGYNRM